VSGDGTSAASQNGHALSVDSTWRWHEGQGTSDRIETSYFALSFVFAGPSVAAPAS
jgi:hypothetical protein